MGKMKEHFEIFKEGALYYREMVHPNDKQVDWESQEFNLHELSDRIKFVETVTHMEYYSDNMKYRHLRDIHDEIKEKYTVNDKTNWAAINTWIEGYQHQMKIELTENYLQWCSYLLEEEEE